MIDLDNVQEQQEENPLLFWVAYLPNGDKKNYLSDGKGHIRVFKIEIAIREYLDTLRPLMSAETHSTIVVHSIQGTIAVPDDGVPQNQLANPTDMQTPIQISTFAPSTVPTASEQLDSLLKQRKSRRRK
jgi:hypothetical protein